MNIYLHGLIGAGKTTLGKSLSQRLSWTFYDVDAAMEEEAGKPFRRIVAEEGWLGYRHREYRIIKHVAGRDKSVLALGGGTLSYQWNRDAIQGTGAVILLTAELSVLAERVRYNDRPRVFASTLEEDLQKMWEERGALYLSLSDIVYRTDSGKAVPEQTEEVIELLQRKKILPVTPHFSPVPRWLRQLLQRGHKM